MTDLDHSRRRWLLPLLNTTRHGSRSHATCHYKCGNACDAPVPNTQANPEFRDVAEGSLSRRGVLKAAGAGALVVAAGQTVGNAPAAAASEAAAAESAEAAGAAEAGFTGHGDWRPAPSAPLTFRPVKPNFRDAVVTARGYDHSVLIRWGDPVEEGAPAFDVTAQTPAAQAKQFGYYFDIQSPFAL